MRVMWIRIQYLLRLTNNVSDIVDDNGCLSSTVVHWGQTVVALLACRVPDLKLDCCVIEIHRLSQERS